MIQSLRKWIEKHPEIVAILLIVSIFTQLISTVSFIEGDIHANWLGLFGHASAWIWLTFFGIASYPIQIALIFFAIGLFSKPEKPMRQLAALCIGTFSLTLLLSLLENLAPKLELHIARWAGFVSQTGSSLFHLGGLPMYYLFCKIPYCNLQYLLNNTGSALIAILGFGVSALLLFEYKLIDALQWTKEKAKQLFTPKQKEKLKEAQKKRQPVLFANLEEHKQGLRDEQKSLITTLREKLRKSLWDDQREQPAEDVKAPPLLSRNIELPPSFNNIPESLKATPKMEERARIEERPKREERSNETVKPEEKPKAQPRLPQASDQQSSTYAHFVIPDIDHLNPLKKNDLTNLKKELKQKADLLEETLLSFGIEAKVGEIYSGPTITSFEVHPAVGVKVGRIKTLEHDIALNLEAKSIRIIAPIPGKAAVGVEVPNKNPQEVTFREILASYQAMETPFRIPLLLGKGANGDLVMTDLTKMPHCIIAGATGSGKSVCINSIVMSILMTARPDEIRLLMIDPKKVELTPYSDLPHMLAPVITEPQSACLALNWLVKEMEKRYEMLKLTGQRNIDAFNKRKIDVEFEKSLDIQIPERLPYYVAIIDELADLMMVASQDIETPIARIAQMARAVGIHMILATQRPSREVITGLIKANFPSRIAFKVASRVNSQIILDETGAETLLGNGDMLMQLPGSSQLLRAQGAFVRDEEIQRVIDSIGRQAPPQYTIKSFEKMQYELSLQNDEGGSGPQDALFDEAKAIVFSTGNASTTFLQRKLKIGYARAASLMDELESSGIVGPQEGAKPRKIFYPAGAHQGDSSSGIEDSEL